MSACRLTTRTASLSASEFQSLLAGQRIALHAARVDFVASQSTTERRLRQVDALLEKVRRRLHRLDAPHVQKMPSR